MPLLPLYETAEHKDTTTQPKMGVVFDNNDPLKLGRVKATIEGMYTQENAPWIRRKAIHPLGAGGEKKSEFFAVPEVNTKIWVEFPFDDDSFPYYTEVTTFGKFARTEAFTDNYPYEWGWVYGDDFIFKMDTDKGTFLLKNGESYISGEIKGKTVVYGKNVTVEGTETVDIKGAKKVNVKGGDIKIDGSSVTINQNTKIDGKVFLSHRHSNGNDGHPTGGVI